MGKVSNTILSCFSQDLWSELIALCKSLLTSGNGEKFTIPDDFPVSHWKCRHVTVTSDCFHHVPHPGEVGRSFSDKFIHSANSRQSFFSPTPSWQDCLPYFYLIEKLTITVLSDFWQWTNWIVWDGNQSSYRQSCWYISGILIIVLDLNAGVYKRQFRCNKCLDVQFWRNNKCLSKVKCFTPYPPY